MIIRFEKDERPEKHFTTNHSPLVLRTGIYPVIFGQLNDATGPPHPTAHSPGPTAQAGELAGPNVQCRALWMVCQECEHCELGVLFVCFFFRA